MSADSRAEAPAAAGRPTRRSANARRFALALAISLLAFAALYLLLGKPEHGIDDADITAVYARNIAKGAGYVYTHSGERVEGSTSLAWTLISALCIVVGGESSSGLFALSVLLCAVALFLPLTAANRMMDSPRAQWSTALLLAVCPAFFMWTLVTLMDSALWCASLGTALLLAIVPRTRQTAFSLPFALGFLILVRPEGMLVAPALALLHGLAAFLRGAPGAAAMAAVAWPLMACVATAAALIGFRLSYFGFPFPNTYYAKMGGDRLYHAISGLRYDLDFVREQPLHGLALVLAIYASVRDAPRVWQRLRGGAALNEPSLLRFLVLLFVLGGFALPLLEGGDHFWGARMLQPFVPWLALMLAVEVAMRLPAKLGRGARIAGVMLGLACVAGAWFDFVSRNLWVIRHEFNQATHGRKLADLLEQSLKPGARLPTVGVTAAGGFAYGYAGRAVDLMGLNWVAMAHSQGDRRGYTGHAAFSADVFWAEPPDLVSPNLLPSAPASACDVYSPWDDGLVRGLLSSERFRLAYVALSLPTREGAWVSYAHREFLAEQPDLAVYVLKPEADCAASTPKRASMPMLEWPAIGRPKE